MKSDATLVESALNNDVTAYAELVRRYGGPAHAAAMDVLGDFHRAQDVCQDAFVQAFEKLDTLRKRTAFGAWLLQIVRRRAIRVARKQRKTLPLASGEHVACPGDNGRLDDASQILLAAVMRLPKHEQQAVMLHYFDGHNVGAVAEMTGHPVGTVTKRLQRARDRLRHWVRDIKP